MQESTRFVTALGQGGAAEASQQLIERLKDQLQGREPALVMVFASTAQPLGEVTGPLAAAFPGVAVMGASTAGEFTHARETSGGVSAVAVAGDFKVIAGIGDGVSQNPSEAIGRAIAGVPESMEGYPHRTAVVFVDALAYSGEETTLLTAALLGDAKVVGGAAGDDLKMQSTHVALGAKAGSDAVVVGVIFSKKPLGVGVAHGHKVLSGPMTITRSQGSTVYEIDGQPAWDVWARATRENSIRDWNLDPDTISDPTTRINFFGRYEAGLVSDGECRRVRAALTMNPDKSMNFATGMPEGMVIRIMETQPKHLIESASEAARRSKESLEGGQIAGAVVFDCAVRKMVLKEQFGEAVSAISEVFGGAPLAGFECYGEIALNVDEFSGFHNSTTVVLSFPE